MTILGIMGCIFAAATGVNLAAKDWTDALLYGAITLIVIGLMWIVSKVTEPSSDYGQQGQPAGHNPRPQAGLSPYSSEFDRKVWGAMETQEQRNGGRNRGGDITVRVSEGRDWATWRAGAHIWEQAQKDNSNGVYVEFDDPGDTPTYNDFGALVPRSGNK